MAVNDVIKQTILFAQLGDDDVAMLAQAMEEKKLPSHTTLFLENMKGESMYVIQSGSIKLSKMISEGEERMLTTLGAGDYFGEMALLEEGPRPVSAIVVDDANILILRRSEFQRLMNEQPQVAMRIILGMYKSLSDRIRQASPQIQQQIMGRLSQP